MKYLSLFLTLLFAAFPALAAPRIVVETTELDFGEVSNRETTERRVAVRNEGDSPLQITDIKSSCPCTGGVMSANTIAPGDEAQLIVTINPLKTMDFETGRILYLLTNDPQQEAAEVHVRSQITPEFTLQPNPLDLGDIPLGETQKATVRFRSQHQPPVEITKVETGPGAKGVDIRLQKIPQGDWATADQPEYDLEVTAGGDALPHGPAQQNYYIATTDERVPSHEGKIHYNVTTFYRISARLVNLGEVTPGETRTISTITADGHLEVVSVRPINPAYHAEATLSEDQQEAQIQLRLPAELEGRAAQEVTLQLRSNGQDITETLRVIGVVAE